MNADPFSFALSLDAFGRLVFEGSSSGRKVAGVRPVRLFPLTEPLRSIALLDPEGAEIAVIDDPAELSEGSRAALAAELARREFLPEVLRVRSIDRVAFPNVWELDTDAGPARLRVAADEHVRFVAPHHLIIVGSNGLRARISDTRRLDAASRHVLERVL
jgi:hypothetical protein